MNNGTNLKAPFPWFGGKRRVASQVWEAFGNVDNYVEPFAGSLAVLLDRPTEPKTETVNDADCYLSNFWRAITAAPDQVAALCDFPVNECDLLARHLWLVNEGKRRIERMESEPDFYDVKVAAWWVWGINQWIGSGWCTGEGPWVKDGEAVRQLPHLGDPGRGVNRKRPDLGGTNGGGRGVHRTSLEKDDALRDYFRQLADRLRRVRVCCGDWARIVTDGALSYGETVGVFLDPPYQGDVRAKDLYRVDNHDISNAVREWALANGNNTRYRIVLAGYNAEHVAYMPSDWRILAYTGNKCYGTTAAIGTKKGNDANRHNERLWFSPHCLRPDSERQGVIL